MDATGEVSLAVDPAADSSSQLTLQSSTNKLIGFRIQLTDMQGKAIDSVRVEEEYWIKVYVRDLRDLPPNSLHLFSAYAELHLDSTLFVATGRGRLGGDFWENQVASKFQGLPTSLEEMSSNQIGGTVVARYPAGEGHLLYQIPVRTVAEGEGVIATKPLQNDPSFLYPTTLYGTNDPIGAESIHYESLPITVLPKATQPSTSLPLPSPTVTPPSPLPDSRSTEPIVSQPVTSQPTSTESVGTQVVVTFPETVRQPIPKTSVAPRQIATESATGTDDQQELQNPIVNEVKLVPLSQSSSELTYAEKLLRILAELTASRSSFFHEISNLGIYQTLSVINHRPLQKHQPDSIKPLQGVKQFAFPPFGNRLEDIRHQDRTWVAKEVIDRMLERLAPGSSIQTQANLFEWEATYSRASMRRLPLYSSQHPYAADEFADVDMKPVHNVASESPEIFNPISDTVGRASSTQSGDLQIAYRRSSMKSLLLVDRGTDLTVPGELKLEVTSRGKQTLEISRTEACENCHSSDATQETRTNWSSYLMVGLTSIYLIFRGQSRKFLNRRCETSLKGDTRVPENR